MSEYRRERLGELLVEAGLHHRRAARRGARRAAHAAAASSARSSCDELIVSEEQIARTLAAAEGPRVREPGERARSTATPSRASPSALARLQAHHPDRLRGRPDRARDGRPARHRGDRRRRACARACSCMPVVATPSQIVLRDREVRRVGRRVRRRRGRGGGAAERGRREAQLAAVEDVPVVRLVNQLIREAVVDRASDIHIEPGENGDARPLPRRRRAARRHASCRATRAPGITSRIKIMADMDIAERRRPQDGRIQVERRRASRRHARRDAADAARRDASRSALLNQGLTFHSLEDLGMTRGPPAS